MKKSKKATSSVSIIGGADGPTSVFVAEPNENQGIIERIKKNSYRRKRNKAEKGIEADPHTLEEVTAYLIEEYGAKELSSRSDQYEEARSNLKESLILEHRPELLGDLQEVAPPDPTSEESVLTFLEKMEERSQIAREVSDEEIPMDFHIYIIRIPEGGEIEFILEHNFVHLSCSFSGSKKATKILERLCQDVYLYYGVTQEDIENQSERYSSLVTILTSK